MPSTKSHTPQIISRQRVADHGEVFTAEREVKAMCDLVKNETERIESRFLEPACCRAVRYLLATNILWGDALTLQTPDDSARPIVFAEWSDIGGGRFKRRDFMLANLLQSQPMEGPNLFSDLGDAAFIPTPVAEYPLVHYLKLGADEEL